MKRLRLMETGQCPADRRITFNCGCRFAGGRNKPLRRISMLTVTLTGSRNWFGNSL